MFGKALKVICIVTFNLTKARGFTAVGVASYPLLPLTSHPPLKKNYVAFLKLFFQNR